MEVPSYSFMRAPENVVIGGMAKQDADYFSGLGTRAEFVARHFSEKQFQALLAGAYIVFRDRLVIDRLIRPPFGEKLRSLKVGKVGVESEIESRGLPLVLRPHDNLGGFAIGKFTKARIVKIYVGSQLPLRTVLSKLVRLDHLIGGPTSVLHGVERGLQSALYVNDAQYRDEQRKARKDRGEQRAIGGTLLCAQILFIVGSLCGGFYMLAHTLENSRGLSTDASTFRALLSGSLILSGGVVMALAFGAFQSP